jgi:uncharacterized OsmC-like protein
LRTATPNGPAPACRYEQAGDRRPGHTRLGLGAGALVLSRIEDLPGRLTQGEDAAGGETDSPDVGCLRDPCGSAEVGAVERGCRAVDEVHPLGHQRADVAAGHDGAHTPVEYLLHAIASCLTAGIANIAAVRTVDLTKVASTVEGDIGLCSASSGGPTARLRNGYKRIEVTFHIEGDADDETLRGIVEQSRRRSAVYGALSDPMPVVIDVVTG